MAIEDVQAEAAHVRVYRSMSITVLASQGVRYRTDWNRHLAGYVEDTGY